MMFADDVVIFCDCRDHVEAGLERCRYALERTGIKSSNGRVCKVRLLGFNHQKKQTVHKGGEEEARAHRV